MPQGRRAPVEEPADEEEIRRARLLLDPTKTSVEAFIESYKVPTKRPSLFEGRTSVEFREYPNQTVMRETIEAQWAAGEGGKLIVGKGRQDGASTMSALLFWERFVRGGGGVWNIFSYDTDATKELFRLFQSFRRQTPEWIFRRLLHGGGEWKRDSAMQMEIVFADGTVSMLQCLTAGDKRSGSGSAPRGILFDELSKWEPDVKRDMTSMTEGWADAPGNLHVIQATGAGKEEFAEMFLRCLAGEESAGYVAKFFPWIGHPDRRTDFKSEEDRRDLAASVGQVRKYGPQDEKELVAAGASLEEIHWRRRKIQSPIVGWDLSLCNREYPLKPEHMFNTSTRTIFHAAREILESHKLPAALRERAAGKGWLEWKGEGVVFVEADDGPWTVFEPPRGDRDYCFGADATSGRQTKGKDGSEPDFAVGDFGEVLTGRQSAYYRGHAEGDVFAEELFKACCWYRSPRGPAEGFVESDAWGKATIKGFEDLKHGGIFGPDVLLEETVEDTQVTHHKGARLARIGYHPEQAAIEVLINLTREWLLEVGLYAPDPASPNDTPLSSQFVEEALLYERNPKNGKAEARTGHDDAVRARGLFLAARKQLIATCGLDATRVAPRRRAESPQRAALREMDEKAAKEYAAVYGS